VSVARSGAPLLIFFDSGSTSCKLLCSCRLKIEDIGDAAEFSNSSNAKRYNVTCLLEIPLGTIRQWILSQKCIIRFQ
jgi:hypothetical protein